MCFIIIKLHLKGQKMKIQSSDRINFNARFENKISNKFFCALNDFVYKEDYSRRLAKGIKMLKKYAPAIDSPKKVITLIDDVNEAGDIVLLLKYKNKAETIPMHKCPDDIIKNWIQNQFLSTVEKFFNKKNTAVNPKATKDFYVNQLKKICGY